MLSFLPALECDLRPVNRWEGGRKGGRREWREEGVEGESKGEREWREGSDKGQQQIIFGSADIPMCRCKLV